MTPLHPDKTNPWRPLWLALGVCAVVGAGAWWWARSGTPSAPQVQLGSHTGQPAGEKLRSTVTADDAARATGPVRLDGHYALTYAIRYTAPGLDGTATAATLTLGGSLEAAQATVAAGRDWLAVRFNPTLLASNAPMQAATQFDEATLRAGLTQRFAVQLDADGRVMQARFAPSAPQPAQAVLAAVAFAGQFARPQDAPAKQWQTQERDVPGEYRANYTVRADGGFDKAWQLGDDAAAAQTDPTGRRQTNRVEFRVIGRRIHELRMDQTGSLNLGALDVAQSTSTFRVEMTLRRTGDSAAAWMAGLDPAALVPFDPTAQPSQAAGQPKVPPMAEVLQAVAAAGSAPQPAQRSAMRSAAIDALRAHPTAASELDAALRRGNLAEPAERTLLEALAAAGTEPAQASLVGLAVDRALADGLRDRAILAATQVSKPSAAFVAALLAAVDATGGQTAPTTYAVPLGAALRQVAASDPQRAKVLSGELVGRAREVVLGNGRGPRAGGTAHAPTLGDQRNWMAALGNSGDPAALPVLLETLQSPKEALRLAAAHALRFQDPAASKEAMAFAMAHDDSPEVRAALLHAARYMGPPAMQTFVEKALRFDLSELVRIEAAYTLATWSTSAPGLRKVLAVALQFEKSAKVQTAIADFLKPTVPVGAGQ